MIPLIALTILLAGQAGTDKDQRLQSAFDRVVQSGTPGWILVSSTVSDTTSLYKWRARRDESDVVALDVRRFVNEFDAEAELEGTPRILSIGATRVDGLGDGAFVAGLPGAISETYYIRVDNILVQLRLPRSINDARRIADGIVEALRDTR